MNKTPIWLLISALSISCLPVHGQQLDELIIPVTGTELAEVYKQKDFAIREKLYYSKAHQIVKVNDGLLYNAEKFRITLIGNVQLTVETTAVEETTPGAISWHGLIVPRTKERVPIRRASGEPLPEAKAEQLYEDIYGISIYVTEWDQNNETREVRRVMYRPKGFGFEPPTSEERIAAGAWRDYQPNAFRTVRTRIAIAGSDKVFRIETLDDSEYHVLFEENRDRMDSMRIDTPYGPSSAEAVRDQQLHQDYVDFLEALRQEKAAREKEAGRQ